MRFRFLLLFTLLSFVLAAQDKRNGRCKIGEPNGNQSIGRKKHGLKAGEWITLSPQGATLEVVTYVRGYKTGPYRSWHTANPAQQYWTGYFKQDQRNGTWTQFSTEGDTLLVATYRNDTLNGTAREFQRSKNATVQISSGVYIDGKREGWWTTSYFTMKFPQLDSHYYVNDHLHGPSRTYADNHLLVSENFENGMLNGKRVLFYRNSTQPKSISYHKKNKVDSVYTEYAETGAITRRAWYGGNGVKKYDSAFFDKGGISHVTLFSESGERIHEEARYPDGHVHSKTYYDAAGNPDSSLSFYPDGVVSERIVNFAYAEAIEKRYNKHIVQYHRNGTIAARGDLINSRKNGMWLFFDSTNTKVVREVMYAGDYPNGRYRSYYPNGKIKISAITQSGYLDDSLKVYDKKGALLVQGSVAFDTLIKKETAAAKDIYYQPAAALIDVNGVLTSQPPNPPAPVLSFAQLMPHFPGGPDSLQQYLRRNIRYPVYEKEQGKSGTVYISFIVNEDGTISDAAIKKGVDGAPGLGNEALRVINQMPRWVPGENDHKAVRVQMYLPVRFTLH